MFKSQTGVVLFFLASGAAMAAQPNRSASLQQITTTRSGSVWYLDRATLKTDGRTASAWLTMDHSRDKTERARETRALIEFECAGDDYRWVQYFSYRRNGSEMPERVPPNVTRGIAPGSPVEAAKQALCRGG